ncbi:MAG: nitroreductase family protein [Promethearchaeota archaeon]
MDCLKLEDFEKPIPETIQKRSSWRTYEEKPLEEHLYEKVKKILNREFIGPFGNNKARFKLIEIPLGKRSEKRKYGTYGFIKGAPYFIVGAITNNKYGHLDYGYVFEKIILLMTEYDLGTCWLGGTFKRDNFAQFIGLKSNEILPAVSPLGYTLKRRRALENIMRLSVSAKKRKPWSEIFFKNDFKHPLNKQDLGEKSDLIEILECVRLAPSARNKQPWRILYLPNRNEFHFFVQKPDSNPNTTIRKFQRLDIGIAICHFDLAVKYFQKEPKWFNLKDTKISTINTSNNNKNNNQYEKIPNILKNIDNLSDKFYIMSCRL